MRRYGVALLSEPHEPLGAATYAIEVVRAMAPLLEPDERLVVMRHRRFPRPVRHPRVEDVPLAFPAWRSPLRRLFEQLLVPPLGLLLRLDLIHGPNHVLPLLWPGRAVLTVHDTRLFSGRRSADLGRFVFREFVYPASLRRATATLADTAAAAREVARAFGLDESRFRVVHLGVNGRFARGEAAPSFWPPVSECAYPPRPRPYILHVGQHEPHKNLPRLVGAFARAVRSVPPGAGRPALVLAGPRGRDTAEIEARIRSEGLEADVVRLGYVSDERLPALYRGALALAYPSLLEGFGLPPLEAMASGVPVLAADIPVLRETLGEGALLVDPEDEAEIAAGLVRLMGDEGARARLAAAGRERVALFTWRRAAERTLAVYREVSRVRH